MTAVLERTDITEPGLYPDMPDDVYHRDPVAGGSLSHSGAKTLLGPAGPARHQWNITHPVHKPAFDLGGCAHKLVLDAGPAIHVVAAADWRTNAAKAQRDEARSHGRIPVLAAEYEQARAMADALRRHPLAAALLNPDRGAAEQSVFWRDDEFGIWRRARLDWTTVLPSGQFVIVDYKSAASAEKAAFTRAAFNFGYVSQDPFYCDAATAAGMADDPAFVFIAQEKTAPYLVQVFDLDDETRQIGIERNRRAMEIYRDCKASGHWPAYSAEIETVSPPRWAVYQHEES